MPKRAIYKSPVTDESYAVVIVTNDVIKEPTKDQSEIRVRFTEGVPPQMGSEFWRPRGCLRKAKD